MAHAGHSYLAAMGTDLTHILVAVQFVDGCS
jgi:hypothetical protein